MPPVESNRVILHAMTEDAGTRTTIRAQGHDEIWLQDRLAAEPQLLGLGDVEIRGQEVASLQGGNLDILAADDDTYYSVEVQLGEVDASHSFRVFDYWARNRMIHHGKAHVAVLVVESASGRFRPALKALAEYLPLIVIELRAHLVAGNLGLTPHAVIANAELDISVVPSADELTDRSEEDWKASVDESAWSAYEAVLDYAMTFGVVRPEYRQKSYVTLRRGRRAWVAVRFTTGAIWLNLVDPDGNLGTGSPSEAFQLFAPEMAAVGVPITWNRGLNAGKQPISVMLRRDDAKASIVRDLMKASWDWLDQQAEPFSDKFGPRDAPVYSAGPDWGGDFDPYYEINYHEVGYPGRGVTAVEFVNARDESRTIMAVDDGDWSGDEFAERILTHHMEKRPTKVHIAKFKADAMRNFALGDHWSLTSDELAAMIWGWG